MSAGSATPEAGVIELARVHLAQSRPDRALETLSRAVPEGHDFWVLRATALHNLERYEDAAKTASEGLKSIESLQLMLVLASAWTELNRLADAERVILQALSREPQNEVCLSNYAMMLATGGQFEKAAAVAAEAVRCAPSDVRTRSVQAITMWLNSDDRRAEQQLRAVLAEAPEDQASLLLLAAIEGERGEHHIAYARMRRVLASDPARIASLREILPDASAAAHPLLRPVRPFMTRTGPAVLWLAFVAILLVGVLLQSVWLVVGVAGAYVIYAVYGHLVFRWIRFRSSRRFS